MNTFKKVCLFCSFTALLSGCATQRQFVSLPETVQKEITSTDAYVEDCKKEMQADVKSSNISTYVGGGLIPALIDCAVVDYRQDRANEAMVDIQKEIQSFDFNKNFTDKLMNTLQNTVWLKVAYIHSINQLDDKSIRALVNKTKSDSLLTAKLRYRLNPEFTVLTGTLYVELYPISPKIQKLVNCEDPLKTPIFKVNVSASASLPQVGEDIEDNAKY